MKPYILELKITLHEATFFASHEINDLFLTEGVLGNYALAYAFGLVRSPYDRTQVGYLEDLPELNDRGLYIAPAWPVERVRYRVEQFNCQSESFYGAMIENAVVELTGRQYMVNSKDYMTEQGVKKRVRPINRPQLGVLKMLSPQNVFKCHLVSRKNITVPRYIRLGKFMSKAGVDCCAIPVNTEKKMDAVSEIVNPLDLPDESQILFGDTVNIHPTPLIRRAQIKGLWWVNDKGKPVIPAGMMFGGL